jgi:hypothetical protein
MALRATKRDENRIPEPSRDREGAVTYWALVALNEPVYV